MLDAASASFLHANFDISDYFSTVILVHNVRYIALSHLYTGGPSAGCNTKQRVSIICCLGCAGCDEAIFLCHPSQMSVPDRPHGPPYCAIALEARSKSQPPDSVTPLHTLVGLKVRQDIPVQAHSNRFLGGPACGRLQRWHSISISILCCGQSSEMIRITVENRPHDALFQLNPPERADRVIKTVATRLHVADGALSAGDQLFEGEDTVLAGDYIFSPPSASGGSTCQG